MTLQIMPSLLELCPELLQCILERVEPDDLGALCQTCRTFNDFISNNKLLFKELYLMRFDDPCTVGSNTEPSWEKELKEIVMLRKILESTDPDKKRAHFTLAASRIIDLVRTSSPNPKASLNIEFLAKYFDEWGNIDVFCSSSSLFTKGGVVTQQPAATEEDRQLSAQVNVLFGSYPTARQPHKGGKKTRPRRTGDTDIHPYARSRVYDLRRYKMANMWGPFMDDGSQKVDWEKVEAIQVDLRYNLSLFANCSQMPWAIPFGGCAAGSYVSMPYEFEEDEDIDVTLSFTQSILAMETDVPKLQKEASLGLDAQDPYGVTGTWARVVCFLDYNDLFTFNFTVPPIPPTQAREPINTQEAIRIIILKMQVTKVEPPGENDGQDFPVVHFKGTSRSRSRFWDGNANSLIRGTARQTPHGAIRWTTFSIFDGEERWRSEGVQVGGVRSARGVLGSWFDKDFDEFGPAGPTAFWKLSDDLDDPGADGAGGSSTGAMQLPFGYL